MCIALNNIVKCNFAFFYVLQTGNARIKATRSESIESSGSSETPGTPVRRNAGATYQPEEVKQSPVNSSSGSTTPRARFSSVSSKRDSATPTNSRGQSYNVTGNTFAFFTITFMCIFVFLWKSYIL